MLDRVSLAFDRFAGSLAVSARSAPSSPAPEIDAPRGTAHRWARSAELEPPAVEELQALRVAAPLRPDEIDFGGLSVRSPFSAPSAADDLRLPPPPVRAPDGDALFRRVSSAVDRFVRDAERPVTGDLRASSAEARMMSLLFGIRGLQSEIRTHRSRHHAA